MTKLNYYFVHFSSAKNIVTARDFEIAQKQKFDIFKPASRTTDEESDPKSLNKKLSQKLVLALKDETCSEKQYILPSTNLQEGESLRIAAERCLIQNCGTSIRARFWSNAPNAIVKRNLSKNAREKLQLNSDVTGVNEFIFLVNYETHFESANDMFAWIMKDELKNYFRNRKLCSAISDLMYEF